MTAIDFFDELRPKEALLEPHAEKLQVEVPKSILIANLRQELKRHKQSIMKLLIEYYPCFGAELRFEESKRHRHVECGDDPTHYFKLTNKRRGHSLGVFTDYEAEGVCHGCGRQAETCS